MRPMEAHLSKHYMKIGSSDTVSKVKYGLAIRYDAFVTKTIDIFLGPHKTKNHRNSDRITVVFYANI